MKSVSECNPQKLRGEREEKMGAKYCDKRGLYKQEEKEEEKEHTSS